MGTVPTTPCYLLHWYLMSLVHYLHSSCNNISLSKQLHCYRSSKALKVVTLLKNLWWSELKIGFAIFMHLFSAFCAKDITQPPRNKVRTTIQLMWEGCWFRVCVTSKWLSWCRKNVYWLMCSHVFTLYIFIECPRNREITELQER